VTDDDRRERPDSLRSWLVATVGAIAMIFTFGTALSYGVFHGPMTESFGVSPVSLSVVFSVMLCTFFIVSGAVGIFGARYPARGLLVGCGALTAVLAPSLYVVDSLLGLTVVFALLGLALGTAFVIVASVVPRWFDARRGVATGLIFVGNGLGLFVLPPIWQIAIAEFGVEGGFLTVIAVTAVSFLLAGVVCRRPRWAEGSAANFAEVTAWLGRLGKTRRFQILFVGIGLAFAWYQLLAAYAIDLFAARGLSEAGASAAFGLIGGVSIASRIGSGYAADYVGSRSGFLASLAVTAAGIVFLFGSSRPALAAGIVLTGLGLGGSATLYIPLLMEVYTPEKDTIIVGLSNIAVGITALTMPPLGTASVAYTGGYTVAIGLTLAIVVAALWAVTAVTRP